MEPLGEQYAHPAEPSMDEVAAAKAAKLSAPPKRLYRGRPGLIVLTTIITELVVIAAVGNQWVTKSLRDYLAQHAGLADYTVGGVKAALTYFWRFAPANGEATKLWGAQFGAIGTLLVLSGLLTWVVSRGSVTFGRIWVSVAAVVTASAPLSIVVRNAIVLPNAPAPGQSRFGEAVYTYPDFGPVLVAGLSLGVVAGLFAALVAVITRKPVVLNAAPAEPGEPAPLNAYGVPTPGYEPPPWQAYQPNDFPQYDEPTGGLPTAVVAAELAENDALTAELPIADESQNDLEPAQPPSDPVEVSDIDQHPALMPDELGETEK